MGIKFEGAIFDLDGTLVHTIEDIAAAANMMFTRNGMSVHGVDYYLQWIGSGAVRFIEQALGKQVEREELMQYVSEFKEIYSENLHDKSRIFEGIPDVLDAFAERGIKLALLSNKPHAMTVKVADHYLSRWTFHPVLGQREEVPRKPDPAAALEIAGIMGADPGNILFVGDSENDILTAVAAGMMPVGVTWGYGRPDISRVVGRAWTVNHPSELLLFTV
ncbi:MAG: HAD family hydrolase [Bacteroidales bacterium]